MGLDDSLVHVKPTTALFGMVNKGFVIDVGQVHARHYYRRCPQIGHLPRWSRLFCLPTRIPTVVKTGPHITPSEVANMYLVQSQTTIPVPEIYDCWQDFETGWWCIWMSYVDGVPLSDLYEAMDGDEKCCLLGQLKTFLMQMRKIAPHDAIAAADGKPSCDQMLQQHQDVYDTEEAFRSHIIDGFLDRVERVEEETGDDLYDYDPEVNVIADEIRSLTPKRSNSFVFTHGSFSPRNIMIQPASMDEGGPLVLGILDWSQAGYYPAYWEYVKASCCEQSEAVIKATHEVKASEPDFLKDNMPDRLFEAAGAEAQAFRRAYRKVWGHGDD